MIMLSSGTLYLLFTIEYYIPDAVILLLIILSLLEVLYLEFGQHTTVYVCFLYHKNVSFNDHTLLVLSFCQFGFALLCFCVHWLLAFFVVVVLTPEKIGIFIETVKKLSDSIY